MLYMEWWAFWIMRCNQIYTYRCESLNLHKNIAYLLCKVIRHNCYYMCWGDDPGYQFMDTGIGCSNPVTNYLKWNETMGWEPMGL